MRHGMELVSAHSPDVSMMNWEINVAIFGCGNSQELILDSNSESHHIFNIVMHIRMSVTRNETSMAEATRNLSADDGAWRS